MAKTLQFRRGTTSELASITPAAGEILIDTTLNTIKIGNDTVAGGKVINGLAGSSYIYVTGNGATDTANGEELAAAYALAKTLTPYGNPTDDPENRVKVIVAPGTYYVGGGSTFPNNRLDIDTHCVDIVSLTGERNVRIVGDINIAGGDLGSVIIRGLEVDGRIYVGSNLYYLRMENCKANSFAHCDIDNMPISLSGTFIDCESKYEGFADLAGSDASGTFINCKTDSGFGGYDSNASGVFTNCTATYYSFGYSGTNTGSGNASGTFTNCSVEGSDSFGGGEGGQASGVFTNCVGSYGSFGSYQSGPNTFAGTITGTLNYCRLTGGEFAPTSGSGKLHYCIDGNGKEVTSGGFGGTSYVFVAGDQSSAIANGQQLLDAYNLAKTMTPFGNALSSTNRVQVVVAPGFYDVSTLSPNNRLDIDTQYIDIISSTGGRDVMVFGEINISAGDADILIRGLDLKTLSWNIYVDSYSDYLKMENCSANGFAAIDINNNPITLTGTFTNCDAYYGFATHNTTSPNVGSQAAGTFTNCTTIYQGFGGFYGAASGTFINCTAGDNSFGAEEAQVSGTFTDCTAGDYSFGGSDAQVSGTFKNCNAGDDSFGELGSLTGKLYYCTTVGTFPTVTSPGRTFYCVDSVGPNNQ